MQLHVNGLYHWRSVSSAVSTFAGRTAPASRFAATSNYGPAGVAIRFLTRYTIPASEQNARPSYLSTVSRASISRKSSKIQIAPSRISPRFA